MLSYTERLPDSVWLKVFQFLSIEDRCLGVRLTCHRWNRIVADPTFWSEVDFAPFSVTITDQMVENLLRRVGKHVKRISFRHCLRLSQQTLSLKMFRLEQLEYVDVSFTNINDEAFYTLTDKHSEIFSLRWRDCKHIRNPGKSLSNLTNLRSLHVESTRKHAATRRSALSPTDLIKIVQDNHSLSCLTFMSSLLLNRPGVLSAMIPHLSRLTELSVTFVSERCNLELASSLKYLPMLDTACLPFHPAIIASIAVDCRRLRTITFTDLVTSLDQDATLSALRTMFKSCQAIQDLSINANYYCGSALFHIITSSVGHRLRSLELHMEDVTLNDYALGFQYCTNLRLLSLFLHYHTSDSDSLFCILAETLPSLQSLHLANLSYTVRGLQTLLFSVTAMEALVLSASKDCTPHGGAENQAMGTKKFCHLRNLSLISPKGSLREESVIALVQICPKLEGIMLEGLTHFNDVLLLNIATSCPLLKGLNIPSTGFRNLSIEPQSMAQLSEQCPLLHTVTLPYTRSTLGDNGAFDELLTRASCLRKFSFWLNSPDDLVSAVTKIKGHRGQCFISSANKDRRQYDTTELYRIFDHQDYVSLLFTASPEGHIDMPRSQCINDSYYLF